MWRYLHLLLSTGDCCMAPAAVANPLAAVFTAVDRWDRQTTDKWTNRQTLDHFIDPPCTAASITSDVRQWNILMTLLILEDDAVGRVYVTVRCPLVCPCVCPSCSTEAACRRPAATAPQQHSNQQQRRASVVFTAAAEDWTQTSSRWKSAIRIVFLKYSVGFSISAVLVLWPGYTTTGITSDEPGPILRNFSGCTISKVHVWCNALTLSKVTTS